MSATQCVMLARCAARSERTETMKETKTLAKRKFYFRISVLSTVLLDCYFVPPVIVVSSFCCVRWCAVSYVRYYLLVSWRLWCTELGKLSRLLKAKGIDASDPGRAMDPVEVRKEKLLARDEEKVKRQSERHVPTKTMCSHPVPRLFVSRRNDKNPNGFNCAICQKDVSFLSRGPRGIWRHFKCKVHYLKDRRSRFDHEEVIYTENFDAISVNEISAELREGIEKNPPVTLGKMNRFLEDKVDALFGVPSNVPPSTLVVCLLELLRRGYHKFSYADYGKSSGPHCRLKVLMHLSPGARPRP